MQALARELARQLGADCAPEPQSLVAGSGQTQRCYCWRCADGPLFVKVAGSEARTQLTAEAAGLVELAQARALRVPQVRAQGVVDGHAFLALEWIEAGVAGARSERRLGEGLAALHQARADRFGWRMDNHIGRTVQPNGWSSEWLWFWRERRLRPQLALAACRGFGRLLEAPGERTLEAVAVLLAGHQPLPSLLHGDLWAGNWCAADDELPVIFDPAVYFGDRETDLAMTRLFGGFGRAFYEAYEAAAPLPAGYAVRAELYNLYHVLNHANLFGGGYVQRARTMMDRLLAEVHG